MSASEDAFLQLVSGSSTAGPENWRAVSPEPMPSIFTPIKPTRWVELGRCEDNHTYEFSTDDTSTSGQKAGYKWLQLTHSTGYVNVR